MPELVNPPGWPRPRGYSNGAIAEGRILAIAGQIGLNDRGEILSDDLVEQCAQALKNIVTVLTSANAIPSDVIRMTWYVTDVHAYREASARIGQVYREHFGGYYPAMSLVVVQALLDDRAKIEIEATAVIAPR
jgi:enamine deaminase RidA (YjgF/YER057c/UK114 family)